MAWALFLALAGWAYAGPAVPPLFEPGNVVAQLEYESRSRPLAVIAKVEKRLAQPSLGWRERYELLRLLGASQIGTGQRQAAEASVQRLAQIVDQAEDPALKREATRACQCLQVSLFLNLGPMEQAVALVAGLAADEQLPPQVNLNCLIVQALIQENKGQMDEAVRLWQDALRIVDRSGPGWRRSGLRSSMAYTLHHAGQAERAYQLMTEAKQMASGYEDWISLSEALSVESILLTDTGHPVEELAALTGAVAYARKAGADQEVALGLANLSDYYLRTGDYALALRVAQEAIPLAQQSRYDSAAQLASGNMGLALIALHRKQEGLALLRKALDQWKLNHEWISQVDTLKDMARFLEQAGYYADALATYRELREVSQEAAHRSQQQGLAELQESFEAERRRNERALLSDDNLLKAEALRQSELRFKQWALAAGAAGMALVLMLLGQWRLRQAQRTLRHSTERLKVQSEQDPLTGLANRRHLQRIMAEQSAAQQEVQGQLYLLDLDHFKLINDRFGHAAGDEVLIEVARRLRAVVREDDLVVRWGGEEFLVLVPPGQADQTESLARRMLAALASVPVVVDKRHLEVSTSIGFASIPLAPGGEHLSWAQALDLVDSAMYIAKTQGRNRAVGVQRWQTPNAGCRTWKALGATGGSIWLSSTARPWAKGR